MTMNFAISASEGISVPNAASLNPSGQISLCAWVFPVSTSSSRQIIVKSGASPATQYQIRLQKTGSDLKVRFSVQDVTHQTTTVVNVSAWNFLVGTYDGTDLRIYLDGVFDLLLNSPGLTMTDNGEPVGIGQNVFASDLPFDGDLDDLRIYDRALSAAEVQTLHTLRGRDNIAHGLISRWTVREKEPGATASVAGSIKDIGPNGNNGNPINTPTYTDGILAFG